VWVVKSEDLEHLIPATQDAVLDVNLDSGKITVADWLLDVEDA
jgi:ribosomal 30S subunit maturation factor RimM